MSKRTRDDGFARDGVLPPAKRHMMASAARHALAMAANLEQSAETKACHESSEQALDLDVSAAPEGHDKQSELVLSEQQIQPVKSEGFRAVRRIIEDHNRQSISGGSDAKHEPEVEPSKSISADTSSPASRFSSAVSTKSTPATSVASPSPTCPRPDRPRAPSFLLTQLEIEVVGSHGFKAIKRILQDRQRARPSYQHDTKVTVALPAVTTSPLKVGLNTALNKLQAIKQRQLSSQV